MGGVGGMGMVSIARVRNIFPDVGVRKAFVLELGDEFVVRHLGNSSVGGGTLGIACRETTTPSLQKWGLLQKGRAVFRREDRCTDLLFARRRSGSIGRWRSTKATSGVTAQRRLLYRVV